MRNFKRILLPAIVVVFFLVAFEAGSRFLYQDIGNMVIYTRNDLKKNKGDIETLLLGTSLVHWGINGQMLGDALESTTFNLATSAQPINASYYLLKDESKYNDLKRVFLGVHVSPLTRNFGNLVKVRQGIYDRLLSPAVRLEYLYQTADCDEYPRYLFYLARVGSVFDFRQVKKNIDFKLSQEFKNNLSPRNMKYVYQGMGDDNTKLVYKGTYAEEKLPKRSVWNRENIIKTNEEYLQKIGDFCQEKGIELNLVIMPAVPEVTRLMGDLQDMHEYYQEFCDRNGARLFDFNEYENIHELLPNKYYQDEKHLNSKGAKKITGLLAEWYKSSRK